jgi:hypothetical protein
MHNGGLDGAAMTRDPTRRMAGDFPRTLAIMPRPASGGPRGYAASAWVLCRPIAWGPHEAAAEEIEARPAKVE